MDLFRKSPCPNASLFILIKRLDGVNQRSPASAPAFAQSSSEAVVLAVAEAEGASPLDLRPLGSVIDPEELDHLVDSMTARPDGPTGRVVFVYAGYEVTVTGGGDVSLSEWHGGETCGREGTGGAAG